MNDKKELGRIESTYLGYEDHGIFTFWISFDFGGSSQSFGGYALDTYNKDLDCREGTEFGMDCIARILNAVGVDEWGKLVGKEMWVYRDNTPSGWASGKIIGIEAPAYRKNTKPFFMKDAIDRWVVPVEVAREL